MGFFSNIKKTIKKVGQTIIPGGSKGYLEPKKKQLGKPIIKSSEAAGMSGSEKAKYQIVDTSAGTSALDQIPEGNIQDELRKDNDLGDTAPKLRGGVSSTGTSVSGGTGQAPAEGATQTIQTEHGDAVVTQQNEDGSFSYQTEDGSNYYTDKDGKTTVLYSGSVMPITADDIMTVVALASGIGAIVKGVISSVVKVASAKAATSIATKEIATAAGGKFTTKAIVNVGKGASKEAVEAAVKGAGKGTIVNIATRAGVNSKTGGLLLGMIGKSGGWMGKSAAAIGTAMGIASSYIFSGFIEEEASQQLVYAYNTALSEGDLEGAQAIINLDADIYDDGFIDAIPGINGIDAIRDYYKANKLAREGRQKKLDRILRGELTPGEAKKQFDNDQIYGKVNPETGEYELSPTELAKREEAAEYYNNLQKDAGEPTSNYNKATGKYEPSSSLGFGLLRTPGGYEDTKVTKPDTENITLEAYNALTDEERALLTAEEIKYIESRLGL